MFVLHQLTHLLSSHYNADFDMGAPHNKATVNLFKIMDTIQSRRKYYNYNL